MATRDVDRKTDHSQATLVSLIGWLCVSGLLDVLSSPTTNEIFFLSEKGLTKIEVLVEIEAVWQKLCIIPVFYVQVTGVYLTKIFLQLQLLFLNANTSHHLLIRVLIRKRNKNEFLKKNRKPLSKMTQIFTQRHFLKNATWIR